MMNTFPPSLPNSSSAKPPGPVTLAPDEKGLDEKGLDELAQMAAHGNYVPGVTAKDLAAAKRKVYQGWQDIGGEDFESIPKGGDTVLHDAARSGHYPPGTTLQLLAETNDAESNTVLEVALVMWRVQGLPLPSCCTGPALAKLECKCSCGYPSWLHYAATHGLAPPDTTPELLISTVGDGWTALHAAADNGNLITGITIRMLKGTVTPVTYRSAVNYSALEAFKKHVDLVRAYCLAVKIPLAERLINSTENLLRASAASVPNLESLREVRELAEILQPIAPGETALWVAAELWVRQQN
jgi:hypothetical protein